MNILSWRTVVAVAVAMLAAWMSGAIFNLDYVWVLLPDLWDNAIIAGLLAFVLAAFVMSRSSSVVYGAGLVLLGVLALHLFTDWDMSRFWLTLVSVVTSGVLGIVLSLELFSGKASVGRSRPVLTGNGGD